MSGGQAVNSAWCAANTPDTLALSSTRTYVLYVGQPPAFDACMQGICVSRQPSSYGVGYLPSFHVASKVEELLSKEMLQQLVDSADGSNDLDLLQLAVTTVVQDADAGWVVGDGSAFDPCRDPHAPRNVIAALAVFGALLLLVALDGVLLRYGNVDVLGCGCCSRGRRYGWWRTELVQRVPKRLLSALLAGWYLLSGAAIMVDVVLDAVLLSQLLPLAAGYAMLATLCASFLAVGLAAHLHLVAHVAKANSGASWLLRLYWQLAQREWLMLVASLVLVPLLVASCDIVLIATGLAQAVAAARHSCCGGDLPSILRPNWLLLGAFSPARCFTLRSMLTVVLQSWPSIALTTWGYLALYKYEVGRFITAAIFLANLAASMAHTLLAAWSLKELWVRHGSWAGALREVFSLAPAQPAGWAGRGTAETREAELELSQLEQQGASGPPRESKLGML